MPHYPGFSGFVCLLVAGGLSFLAGKEHNANQANFTSLNSTTSLHSQYFQSHGTAGSVQPPLLQQIASLMMGLASVNADVKYLWKATSDAVEAQHTPSIWSMLTSFFLNWLLSKLLSLLWTYFLALRLRTAGVAKAQPAKADTATCDNCSCQQQKFRQDFTEDEAVILRTIVYRYQRRQLQQFRQSDATSQTEDDVLLPLPRTESGSVSDDILTVDTDEQQHEDMASTRSIAPVAQKSDSTARRTVTRKDLQLLALQSGMQQQQPGRPASIARESDYTSEPAVSGKDFRWLMSQQDSEQKPDSPVSVVQEQHADTQGPGDVEESLRLAWLQESPLWQVDSFSSIGDDDRDQNPFDVTDAEEGSAQTEPQTEVQQQQPDLEESVAHESSSSIAHPEILELAKAKDSIRNDESLSVQSPELVQQDESEDTQGSREAEERRGLAGPRQDDQHDTELNLARSTPLLEPDANEFLTTDDAGEPVDPAGTRDRSQYNSESPRHEHPDKGRKVMTVHLPGGPGGPRTAAQKAFQKFMPRAARSIRKRLGNIDLPAAPLPPGPQAAELGEVTPAAENSSMTTLQAPGSASAGERKLLRIRQQPLGAQSICFHARPNSTYRICSIIELSSSMGSATK